MFVSKSIGNVEVVVQPGTVQGFTKHKTLHYTGDIEGQGGEREGRKPQEKRRESNKREGGERLKSSHSWVTREKQGHIMFGRDTDKG